MKIMATAKSTVYLTFTITKMDAHRTDALDQWWLKTLPGLKWHQYVHNDELRRMTKQPKLTVTAIIQSQHLSLYSPTSGSKERNIQTYKYGEKQQKTLFWHIEGIDDDAGAKIRVPLHHIVPHHPARSENSQSHIEWSSWPGSETSSVEADIYIS